MDMLRDTTRFHFTKITRLWGEEATIAEGELPIAQHLPLERCPVIFTEGRFQVWWAGQPLAGQSYTIPGLYLIVRVDAPDEASLLASFSATQSPRDQAIPACQHLAESWLAAFAP